MSTLARRHATRRPSLNPHRPSTLNPQPSTRRGFTLIEMLVSVTLVMLMMLMFAEIYGIAQGVISKQKSIADNDQKARILSQILRNDLQARTMRSVYPFKTEMFLPPPAADGDPQWEVQSNFPILDPVSLLPDVQAAQTLKQRRGFFSFSENDPSNDSDDVLHLTINVAQPELGSPSRRLSGKAVPVSGLTNGFKDGPEYDDAWLNNATGASPMAEVTYFLRYGNLYRSVLLIRKPYLEGGTGTKGQTTPAGFPSSYPNFWRNFDYSAYREQTVGNPPKVTFHGASALDNDPNTNAATAYLPVANTLFLPRTLAAPQMRYGFLLTLQGQPLEFGGTTDSSATTVTAAGGWPLFKGAGHGFIGRFTAQERADASMTYPGSGFIPFQTGLASAADANQNGIVDTYENGRRRSVNLILPNVHSFDIQVWDDIVGQYVNLGHNLRGPNPFLPGHPIQDGFYNISRLRTSFTPATIPPGANFHIDSGAVPQDFGNRFDTWCPNSWISSAAKTSAGFPPNTTFYRTGRAPYRPLKANPNPNTAAFNSNFYESNVEFGDTTLNDDADSVVAEFNPATGTPVPDIAGGNPTGDDGAEAPLRAIRIIVRFIDSHSGATRQVTIEQALID